jgi:hypothetical protein
MVDTLAIGSATVLGVGSSTRKEYTRLHVMMKIPLKYFAQ